MSVILLFWDWADAPAPPPPPPPPPPPGAGGGKKRNRKYRYEPIPVDYWDTREAYLRSQFPQEELPPAPPVNDAAEYISEMNRKFEERKQQIEALTAERADAIAALRSAPDIKTMQEQGARVAEITTKIAELAGKQALHTFIH